MFRYILILILSIVVWNEKNSQSWSSYAQSPTKLVVSSATRGSATNSQGLIVSIAPTAGSAATVVPSTTSTHKEESLILIQGEVLEAAKIAIGATQKTAALALSYITLILTVISVLLVIGGGITGIGLYKQFRNANKRVNLVEEELIRSREEMGNIVQIITQIPVIVAKPLGAGTRAAALVTLGEIDNSRYPQLIPFYQALLIDDTEDVSVRSEAASCLKIHGKLAARALTDLVKEMANTAPEIRRECVRSIISICLDIGQVDSDIRLCLEEAAENDSDPRVKATANTGLSDLRSVFRRHGPETTVSLTESSQNIKPS